jgi:hypothetical protein
MKPMKGNPMSNKKLYRILVVLAALALLTSTLVSADDGVMFRKNISKTPEQETERANINHMAFYVPAQSSDGTLLEGIEYYLADGSLHETREYAKPLVAVYIDGLPPEEPEGLGNYAVLSGAGWGEHDAHAALSLDDGDSWKRTNLSESAHLSSFTLANGFPYPGDAHNMTFAIAGDKVLVGWISKYCDGGKPNYTLDDESRETLAGYMGIDPLNIYLNDIFGVSGSQGSVDYTLQGFPEVGEIPYSCVWSARGTLLEDPETGLYDIVWTKAERLTSGRRDANRLEMAGDSAAGFMMAWQEDPEGLRPGQGLGPGEGWSGAVVNGQTDLWYSYISIENFVMIDEDGDTTTVEDPISIYDYYGSAGSETKPKVAYPMAMPIRLTDNAMCKETNSLPYCYLDFESMESDSDGNLILPDTLPTGPTEASTFCTDTIEWQSPGGQTLNLCVAKDGRVMQGRVGASRPRVNVQPYASVTLGDYDSAWVIMGAEESKALGEGAPTDPGGAPPDDDEPPDIGKNMWYYSFDMLNPPFVMQGGMLNQPAQCNPYLVGEIGCILGDFMTLDDPMYEDNMFYETEIARRFSHMSQPIHQIGPSGVSAALIVKQGILNQGGPADIFLRLTRVPDDVWVPCETDDDPETTERCLPIGYNPYAYENMVCEDAEGNSEWVFKDGSNPRYIEGLCLSNMINVSGTTIVACDGVAGDCADDFPWEGGDGYPKVTQWVQIVDNLSDQTWVNPFDVAKGHRGFIDGDFIMMMYAWSPNWKANSVGNDHYNLYVRRSFDGGETWTTTPADLDGVGTTTCENYGAGSDYTTVCTEYDPGEFEQARNVSQLTGNRITILDPRYTPTGGLKMLPITDLKEIGFTGYDDDVRDPSKFFIVYETGDNTTVAVGEATPLDLFYSRATNWGDDYFLVEYYNQGTGETTLGFDWLENKADDLSGEAANTCNNGGTYYYVIWNQWQEDEHENVSNSDAIFRRVMFLPDAEADLLFFANILYASHTQVKNLAESLTFVGTTRGREPVAYRWRSSVDGELSTAKSFTIPASTLTMGVHTIYFAAQDEHGVWSNEASMTLIVGHRLYLPMTTQ